MNNEVFTILEDKVFGKVSVFSNYKLVEGVGVAVSRYQDYTKNENQVVMCESEEQLGMIHFQFLHKMVLKHEMCRDLVIIVATMNM